MPVQRSDPSKAVITHANSSVEVYYYGCTLTSWKVDGTEKLFLSKHAKLDGTKAIRGGIPLVFPQFGTLDGSALPQHGFARNSLWEWKGVVTENAEQLTVAFGLTHENISDEMRKAWPNEFALTYEVTLTASTLKTTFAVTNTSQTAWHFTSLLHTYFHVPSVSDVRITGLHNISYKDKTQNNAVMSEASPIIAINGEVDRVYMGAPDIIKITGGSDVSIRKWGFEDVVVWNPWIEKAEKMSDFGNEEYKNMVCVEVGSVAGGVQLNASETWKGGQTLSVV
ncbi:galactose mutarotase-like domain-containing protein [Gaertneriomyces semiglobifer]|nr:galactose mutarotase-like domain-containing protein [Gaertneriomyces semiglobifer]